MMNMMCGGFSQTIRRTQSERKKRLSSVILLFFFFYFQIKILNRREFHANILRKQGTQTYDNDTLSAAGVVLHNYYVQPVCTPSRGALMTGVYPARTGLQHLVFYDSTPDSLPPDYVLLPQRLKNKGYVTRMIGKWHLGYYQRNLTPTFRGFDSHYGYWTGSTDYFQKTSSELLPTNNIDNLPPDVSRNWTEPFAGLDWRDGLRPMTSNSSEYVTDLFTRKAVEIIRSHNRNKPLFLYMAQLAVHRGNSMFPIRTPEKYVRGYEYIKDRSRRHFAGKLKALDQSVGFVLEALLKAGMLKDSIIVFTSDNGAANHGPFITSGSNWPLRAEKNTLFEGGIRVPAFVWSPRIKNMPRISNRMMHIVDWLPTLYSAAGGNVQDLGTIDGMNLWPSIQNDAPSPRTGFLVNIDSLSDTRSIRQGDWKLVKSDSSTTVNSWYGPLGKVSYPKPYPAFSMVQWVLRRFYRKPLLRFRNQVRPIDCGGSAPTGPAFNGCGNTPCLFNITEDPCEYRDLSTKYPEKIAELEQLLQATRTVPPLASNPNFTSSPMFHCGLWDTWLDTPSV